MQDRLQNRLRAVAEKPGAYPRLNLLQRRKVSREDRVRPQTSRHELPVRQSPGTCPAQSIQARLRGPMLLSFCKTLDQRSGGPVNRV